MLSMEDKLIWLITAIIFSAYGASIVGVPYALLEYRKIKKISASIIAKKEDSKMYLKLFFYVVFTGTIAFETKLFATEEDIEVSLIIFAATLLCWLIALAFFIFQIRHNINSLFKMDADKITSEFKSEEGKMARDFE